MPKVSVIIPCYNAMRFLPKAVDSVLQQTYQDFEIVMINDGSTDRIEAWADTLEDKRIRFISQTNQGLAAARNQGIEQARGDYIAFLDADDLWHPSKLEKQVSVLEEDPDAGLVYTWVLLVDEQDRPLKKIWEISYEGDVWKILTEGNIIACGSVPMMRSTCVKSVGRFDKLVFLAEDWDFWLRTAAQYPFRVVREVLVYYRNNLDSLSRIQGNDLDEKLQDIEESYRLLISKAFRSAPQKIKYLEARSQALVSLSMAWKALKNPASDRYLVKHYQNQAVSYYPQISLLPEYKKLDRATLFIRFFGIQNYERLKQLFHEYTWLLKRT